ncbi:MAG: cupin domain-containing protein [Syntrophales bacterium]
MPFVDLPAVGRRTVLEGFHARFVHSQNMTFSYWDVEAGHSLPVHSHPHEQVTNVIRGTFEMTVDGETKTIEAGTVVVIAPHAKHSGRSITDCYIIDVFYPVREDYK